MFSSLLLTIFTVVQLNCENLFDCQHDSLKNDIEFLPSSARRYTPGKYWKKLNNISKEIIWCGTEGKDFRLPDIIALCEVENDSVLTYLTKRSSLRTARYQYVMTSSPDKRGIDVALMYNPMTFSVVNHHSIRVAPIDGMRPTRDILYVKGVTLGSDTLHLFVAHLPSKYGGSAHTDPFRRHVAGYLCSAVDSVRRSGSNSDNILIAGDFNDAAASEPLMMLERMNLINISKNAAGSYGAAASYKYEGLWHNIDHILVSVPLSNLLKRCVIKDAPFLLEKDKKYGGLRPCRFWNGYRFNKGYSDHLPLLAEFSF